MSTARIVAAVLLLAALLVGCEDPHACKPGDVDRDHDGRCHEK